MTDGLRHRRPDVGNGATAATVAEKSDVAGWGTLDLMRRAVSAAADALMDLRAMWAQVTVVLGLVRSRLLVSHVHDIAAYVVLCV